MSGPSWAKAPDFAGQPGRIDAVRAQTAVDKQNYLDSGMQPMQCRTCATNVLVRKNSFKHTSVQWTTEPERTCPVFRDAAAQGTGAPRPDSCAQLQASINRAVVEGLIEVRDRDGR